MRDTSGTKSSPLATDPMTVPKLAAEPTTLLAESIAKAWGTDALDDQGNHDSFDRTYLVFKTRNS